MSDKFSQALTLHQQGQLDEALAIYTEISQQQPNNADIWHLLAIISAQTEHLADAKQFIERAIQLDPKSATYYNSLGNIDKKLQQSDSALAAYLQAVAIEPKLASAHNNLAILYQAQAKFELAEQHFQQAIAAKPNYTDAYFNYARLLFEQGKLALAEQQLVTAIELDQQHAASLSLLSKIHYQLTNYSKACHYALLANKFDRNNPELMLNHAACLMKLDQLDAAIAILKKIIIIDPNHVESLHNLGAIYLAQQKTNDALKAYLQQLTIKPDADAYYNAGVIYMYQNRFNDAIVFLERALELKPNDKNTLINLAVTYLQKEDYPQATHYYNQALAIDPHNGEIRYILNAINQAENPKAAPIDYVTHLFDQYAPYYEQHLIEHLHYQVPEHIERYLNNELAERNHDLTILELGCGTGLTGKRIKQFSHHLIGSDIAAKMIEQANKKNIYDELEIADIQTSLAKHNNLDLIVAADVFSYLGDLQDVFMAARKSLPQQGLFIFTIEKNAQASDYQLQKTARYAHSLNYIQTLAINNAFQVKTANSIILRHNKQQPVYGYLVVLKKLPPR